MSSPEDYRCHDCMELVLYRSDHAKFCVYYVNPNPFYIPQEN